jgi:hypothetical protein
MWALKTTKGAELQKQMLQIRPCLDDAVFKNCSITKLWFYKLKRHKTVVLKKEVIIGVSKTPKRLQF